MAALTMTVEDLLPFATIDDAKAQAMIDDAMALAVRAAPCILEEDFEHADAAKAIVRRAILRWNEGGFGGVTQQTSGPFSVSRDSSSSKSMFLDQELDDLRSMCGGGSGAFSIDTVSLACTVHAEVCALNFGAAYCSCGAVLAGYPLYEIDPC